VVNIPVLGASFVLGTSLYNLNNPSLRLSTDTTSESFTTYNVLAESKQGRADRTVVVGARVPGGSARPRNNWTGPPVTIPRS